MQRIIHVVIAEIKSNPNDAFKAIDQLERLESVFTAIFRTLCDEEIVLKKVLVIPPSSNYQLPDKAEKAGVTVITVKDGEEPDLGIFSGNTGEGGSSNFVLNTVKLGDLKSTFSFLYPSIVLVIFIT